MAKSETFEKYKAAETDALRISKEMEAAGHRVEDIEIALLTAIFEAHRGKTLPHTVAKIINNHVSNIGGYYVAIANQSSENG